jgi:hypothetical protein
LKRILLGLAVAAAMALTAAPALAANAGNTGNTTAKNGNVTCRGDLYDNVGGDLQVPAGATCRILGSIEIQGETNVAGNLHTFAQVTFDGKVRVNAGTFNVSNWGVHIHGGLTIIGSQGSPYTVNNGIWSDYSPTVIDGQFVYQSNAGWFYAEGSNTVYGKFTYSGNGHPYQGGLTVHGQSNVS